MMSADSLGKHQPTVSVLVTTYNWVSALSMVIESIMQQSVLPLEILVADDGSGNETRDYLEKVAAHSPLPIRHIWQEDRGFRVSRIRNKAIHAAQGDYIVMLDGDVVLHPYFIADHLAACESGTFVTGSRVILGPSVSQRLFQKGFDRSGLIVDKDVRNRINGLRLPWLAKLSIKRGKQLVGVRSCNMACWKKDLLATNGFDETYEGWGREDTDLALRLVHAGIRRKRVKFSMVVYHLYHKENDRSRLTQNDLLLEKAAAERRIRALKGLDQYQPSQALY